METKTKKFILIASVTTFFGLVVAALPAFDISNTASKLRANVPTYGTVLLSTNGAASVGSLKTNSVEVRTNLGNAVNFVYKNMAVVSGKVGKILPKGFYANSDPINDITLIKVTSNAVANDAFLYYGPTSAYMPNKVDLASASGAGVEVAGANYFKIVATNEVTIDSINIEFGCSTKDYGPIALDADGNEVANGFTFVYSAGAYSMKRSSNTNSVKKAIVPDFYDDGVNGLAPVTALIPEGSTGVFENNTIMSEVYIPNTVTAFGNYTFYTANQMTEFTYPLNLVSATSNSAPKNVTTLNIHSKNLTVSSSISFSSNLKTINVSYDVEKLPGICSSWPSGLVVNYEGTEAEWASLLSAPGSSNYWTNSSFTTNASVICSDTTISQITFSFADASLTGDDDSKVVNVITGKPVSNPGKPVADDPTKKFVGWYDAATGGNEVIFPFNAAGDVTIYAHFEDCPNGASFADPIDAIIGQSYSFTTDEDMPVGYFRISADHDMVAIATITAAASSFSEYVYFKAYNNEGSEVNVSTGSTASNDVKATPTATSTYGINEFMKVRIANGESAVVGFTGVTNYSSRYGEFTVAFSEVSANDGKDFTTARVLDENPVAISRKGVTWATYIPEVSGDYFVTHSANKWAGLSIGTISGNTWTAVVSSFNSSSAPASKIVHFDAGTTYYFAFTCNSDDTSSTITISSEIAPTYAKSSAKEIPLDGTDETVTHVAEFTDRWYKFTAEAKKYRLTSSTTIYNQTGYSSQKPQFVLYNSSDEIVNYSAGRTAKDKVYDLAAGEYFLKISTSSGTSPFTFNFTEVAEEATVKVYANGPDADPTSTETIDAGTAYNLANPTYTSGEYTYYNGFEGWFTDAACTVPFTSGDVINADTNIYAKLAGKYQSNLFNELDSTWSEYINDIFASDTYHFVKDSDEIISTNKGIGSSSSSFSIELKKDAQVSFDYFCTSEGQNWDYLAVYTLNQKGSSYASTFKVGGSSMTEFEHKSYVLTAGNVIKFEYRKDSGGNGGIDMAKIKNLSFAELTHVSLTYDFDYDVDDYVAEVVAGEAITKIADPVRDGYRFDGWYTTTNYDVPFVFANGITVDTTIHAHWVETVTVQIFANGPDAAATETKVIDKGASLTLSNLNTTYYTGFEGWFTDAELTQSIESGATINADTNVYAKLTGKYRNDLANEIDALYPGLFSNIEVNGNAYQFTYSEGSFTSGNAGASSTTSKIYLTLAVDATVSFDYVVSSEASWDKFYFKADSSTVLTESGEVSKSFAATQYTAGTVLKFEYTKDSSGNSGQDKVVISNLVIIAA